LKVVRLILLIIHLGIFLLLTGMLLNAYVPPKVFPWLNLLSLAFPVLISGYILLTLFWIFSWKKRAFVFLFLGLLFFNSIIRWINYSSENKEIPDLKVVSFNVKNGTFGETDIETFINKQKADVVLLQEFGNSEKYMFNELGQAPKSQIVSLFTKHKVISQSELINSNYEYNNAYATQTDIEIKGKIYRFVNIYLQPFKFEKSMIKMDGNNEHEEEKLKNIVKRLIPTFKMHQEQIVSIRKAVDESPYPVILAGDFNSVPNSYEYYHLSEGLEDAFMKVGRGSATSFHDYKFPIRIDYVFTSPSIKPLSYKVDRSVKISDHYPVISTFKLEN
jgi:endonuclease/exonuclease/phosphatase family metal-dependent hydrolase